MTKDEGPVTVAFNALMKKLEFTQCRSVRWEDLGLGEEIS